MLPNGDLSVINEKGLQYYDNLINELLLNNIQPMVTMYHWDLPQKLEDIGGMTNRSIVDYFVDYSKLLLDRYGNRVSILLLKWQNQINTFLVQIGKILGHI